MRYLKRILYLFVILSTVVVLTSEASTVEAARNRRKARRAQVEQLIREKKAVEGDQGYLVAGRVALETAQKNLIQAENADRKLGYQAIADKTGMSLTEIQKRAAAAIKKMQVSP